MYAGAIALTAPTVEYPPGPSSAPIYLDNVECSGTESTIADCFFDRGTTDCDHDEDAGVSCNRLITEAK